MSDGEKPAKTSAPRPAATVMLLRDRAEGLEIFMVRRHHQIDFASGALVFPGGKTAPGDTDPALGALADGAEGWSAERLALAAAAIREAFEESGILLARERSGMLPGRARMDALDHYRAPLDKGEMGITAMLSAESLRLACDLLTPFAHWITPPIMPKRFDTHFFLAEAPADQLAGHDGRESVDSVWIRPTDALAEPKKWKVIFPTKMNLLKLSQASTVAGAIAEARATPPVTVEPWVEESETGAVLRIRADAGYGDVAEPIKNLT